MRTIVILIIMLLFCPFLRGNGVAIKMGVVGSYLRLYSSQVTVTVNNQVAVVTATQKFFNNTGAATLIKYGFPLPDGASATMLRWNIYGLWYNASFTPITQDTVVPQYPGGNTDPNLEAYLGATPLFFSPKDTILPDSSITVELTYVQLLPYKFNKVNFYYPNGYNLIQTSPLNSQEIIFNVTSERTIIQVDFLTHAGTVTNTGNAAQAVWSCYSCLADSNYRICYELSSDELGIYDFSTFLPDSMKKCDSTGRGFFAMIIEPETNPEVAVIQKVFTLVIDRSGSMGGTKIQQAKDAATYIVNHLNLGDQFNIIDFDDVITSFQPSHILYTPTAQNSALNYIDALYARNMTNISGALVTAINQFGTTDTNKANIIIFLTDGEATAGNTSTTGILSDVHNAVVMHNTTINLFTFGIGSSVNEQLLTLLANQNNGMSVFLGSDDLYNVLSEFYLTIQNPVLLNPVITFSPPLITEVHPSFIPNLYKGIQAIITGRYSEPANMTVSLTGNAFGNSILYTYNITLADSFVPGNAFLPKLWAKKKIDELQNQYNSLPLNDPSAADLKAEIMNTSLCYEVMSTLTSFVDNGGSGYSTFFEEYPSSAEIDKLTNSPNPFTDETVIRFTVDDPGCREAVIMIYDISGRLVYKEAIDNITMGEMKFKWNGCLSNGKKVEQGNYYFTIEICGKILCGNMVKI
ncbi:MAG: VWA domain-containing protein [Bacteroidia bacterium]|nr:VWA domain-containing protein [Bacteroidia bacterium]